MSQKSFLNKKNHGRFSICWGGQPTYGKFHMFCRFQLRQQLKEQLCKSVCLFAQLSLALSGSLCQAISYSFLSLLVGLALSSYHVYVCQAISHFPIFIYSLSNSSLVCSLSLVSLLFLSSLLLISSKGIATVSHFRLVIFESFLYVCFFISLFFVALFFHNNIPIWVFDLV